MARSRTKAPARGSSGKRTKPARAARSKRDSVEDLATDAVLDVVETMSCPVLVAEDQAERCGDLLFGAEEARDYAMIAQRFHAGQPHVMISPLLGEVAATLQRHATELASLVDRLSALIDHDRPHFHVEPDDAQIKEIMVAMFSEPPERTRP